MRPWGEGDAPVLTDAWEDPEIARWNPVPPNASVEFATTWILGTHAQTIASIGVDVVLVDDANTVLGEIGLQIDPQHAIAELGFWLHARARGRGISHTLLFFAKELAAELELVGLVALVDERNDAANDLLAKAGWSDLPTKSKRCAYAIRIG